MLRSEMVQVFNMSILGTLARWSVTLSGRRLIFSVALFLAAASLPAASAWAKTGAGSDRWPACDGRATSQQVSFVHVSDVHGQYNPEPDGSTPIGRIRGYYEDVKRENPYTLFTNGGDDYEKGSVAEELSQGQTTRNVVFALGYDVRTLGNHDFAWGIDELLQFSNDPRAVVLTTNSMINGGTGGLADRSRQPWTDYAVLTVGCLKIGCFGLTARPYGADGRQHDGPVYGDFPDLVSDYDYLSIANEIIARHRQEVDLLVLVSHLGLPDDILVAEATTGIDLILGGHSHTALDTPIRVKDTQIVHAGANAEQFGRYDIQYDLENRRIIESGYRLVDNRPGELPSDRTTDQAVADILRPYQRQVSESLAVIKRGHDQPAIAGIAARAVVKNLGTSAAFIDTRNVWPKNWQGQLTRQDLLDAFKVEREPAGTPGGSSLYLMEVKGADLLHARLILHDFAYSGPGDIDPATDYTIAMQKTLAASQQELFGRTIALSPPRPAAELWEIVAAYALDRRDRGLTFADDEDVPADTIISLLAGSNEGARPSFEVPAQPRS
jgi:5'-nucleotidase / UDP-sugar diphosphatase